MFEKGVGCVGGEGKIEKGERRKDIYLPSERERERSWRANQLGRYEIHCTFSYLTLFEYCVNQTFLRVVNTGVDLSNQAYVSGWTARVGFVGLNPVGCAKPRRLTARAFNHQLCYQRLRSQL
jgi:hypothetical protein